MRMAVFRHRIGADQKRINSGRMRTERIAPLRGIRDPLRMSRPEMKLCCGAN